MQAGKEGAFVAGKARGGGGGGKGSSTRGRGVWGVSRGGAGAKGSTSVACQGETESI